MRMNLPWKAGYQYLEKEEYRGIEMVEELKTLKDIKELTKYLPDSSVNVVEAQLKREAIKWIKQISEWIDKFADGDITWWNEVPKEFYIGLLKPEEGVAHLLSISFWIKHFFNIKKEDLK